MHMLGWSESLLSIIVGFGTTQLIYVNLQGLSVTEVTEGYEFAVKKALEILPG